MATNGDKLYKIVEEYSELGVHRAGTDVDTATAKWMTQKLTELGLRVDTEDVPFDRYVADSDLTIDGESVDHLAVYYEWEGSLDTTNVAVESLDPKRGGFTDTLAEPIKEVRRRGYDAAVFVTEHPNDALVAINRDPGAGSGFPTVLVAARDLTPKRDHKVRLKLDAHLEPGHTTNLSAYTARTSHSSPPLLLTTPLTGWFTCAGERGTGVAVLLHLIERFRDQPLHVLATGGHELDYLGARRWDGETPAAIVHVGASVAVDEPSPQGRTLISTRIAMTNLDATTAAGMSEALATIDLRLVTDTQRWMGESEVFCQIPAPMLSFTGSGIDFHTPDDTPERVTSPKSLALVADAIGDAVQAMTSSSNPVATS